MTDSEPDAGVEADSAGSPALTTAPAPATKRAPRARRTRGIISWILVVLAALLIPVSVISVWAIRTVTDTDQYVATMAPLARNPVIVNQLATKATDELFSTKIVQNKVTDILGPKAKPIITPITAEVKTYVHGLALQVFESPKFGRLWDSLNRHSHKAVIDILTGKQTPLTQKLTKGGQLVLNVTPALDNLIDQANSRGVTLFNPLKPILSKGDSLGLTVVSRDQVSKLSGWFNLIVKLKWVVPIIALVLGILAIVISPWHRKALLRVAVGVALMSAVLLAGLSLGRITFLSQAAGHHLDQGVAGAVWDTVLRYLKTDLRWMLLAAVLVALGAWVAGPARYAVWIRSSVAKGGRWTAGQTRQLSSGAGQAAAGSQGVRRSGGWVLEHIKGLRVLGLIVAGLFVVFSGNLTGWSLLIIVIVLAVYLGLLQLVAAWARRVADPAIAAGAGAG